MQVEIEVRGGASPYQDKEACDHKINIAQKACQFIDGRWFTLRQSQTCFGCWTSEAPPQTGFWLRIRMVSMSKHAGEVARRLGAVGATSADDPPECPGTQDRPPGSDILADPV